MNKVTTYRTERCVKEHGTVAVKENGLTGIVSGFTFDPEYKIKNNEKIKYYKNASSRVVGGAFFDIGKMVWYTNERVSPYVKLT